MEKKEEPKPIPLNYAMDELEFCVGEIKEILILVLAIILAFTLLAALVGIVIFY